ncbi:hypothetical protein Clacol_007018 [Clathrus columnatus]|uniref:Beach-domain-containing protein n=1 Tax=Clathrus columnatus TaxID=1419009 RepID=A0AAV5AI39_9AGAM|nr:hypothetical protein Clacol_007018 [Clathrus columnatus]
MLKSIFTPLKTKFDQSVSIFSPTTAPPLPSNHDENNQTDDAQESENVMVLKMCVEEFKVATDSMERIKFLVEIQRVIQADPSVKDVFREIDGFLVVMSLLSTLQDVQDVTVRLDLARNALSVLSDAMLESPRNKAYFNTDFSVVQQTKVGFDALTQSITPFVRDINTTDQTYGLLLGLALGDFSVIDVFSVARERETERVKLRPPLAQLSQGQGRRDSSIPSIARQLNLEDDYEIRYDTYEDYEQDHDITLDPLLATFFPSPTGQTSKPLAESSVSDTSPSTSIISPISSTSKTSHSMTASVSSTTTSFSSFAPSSTSSKSTIPTLTTPSAAVSPMLHLPQVLLSLITLLPYLPQRPKVKSLIAVTSHFREASSNSEDEPSQEGTDIRASTSHSPQQQSSDCINESTLGLSLDQQDNITHEYIPDTLLPHATFKLIERLLAAHHRNMASLNKLGLGGLLFERLYTPNQRLKSESNVTLTNPNFEGDVTPEPVPYALSTAAELLMQKLLRRMLCVGAPTKEVRKIFESLVLESGRRLPVSDTEDDDEDDEEEWAQNRTKRYSSISLGHKDPQLQQPFDTNLLELLTASIKVKMPEHVSFGPTGGAVGHTDGFGVHGYNPNATGGGRGVGIGEGWTFLTWICVENFPSANAGSALLFGIRQGLRHDGKLEFWTNAVSQPATLEKSILVRGRWTHICVVHCPKGAGGYMVPLGIHVDGALTDSLNWPYHRIDQTKTTCVLGCLPNANLKIKIPTAPTTLNPMSSMIPGLPNSASTSLSSIAKEGYENPSVNTRQSGFNFFSGTSALSNSSTTSLAASPSNHSPVSTPKVSPAPTPLKYPTPLPSVSQILSFSPSSTPSKSPAALPYTELSSASASMSSLHLPSSFSAFPPVPAFPKALSTSMFTSQSMPQATAPTFSYAISSATLLSVPVQNVLPRLIHHLGPRYMGLLQDKKLSRFLTYGSATSLSIWLFSLSIQGMQGESVGPGNSNSTASRDSNNVKTSAPRKTSVVGRSTPINRNAPTTTALSSRPPPPQPSRRMTLANLTSAFNLAPSASGASDSGTISSAESVARARKYETERRELVKLLREGTGISEDKVLFYVSSGIVERVVRHKGGEVEDNILGLEESPEDIGLQGSNSLGRKDNWDDITFHGDIMTYRPQCLDVGMWEIGGAGILLRIVEIANTPRTLCSALTILSEALKTSWLNSEDMERIRGYEILAGILRSKSQLIHMPAFEILFEFFGLDFKKPEASTIVNPLAYRIVGLDFDIWARTRKEVQLSHYKHFATLLQVSRYKRFNARQHLCKFGLVKKLLWVLQTRSSANEPDIGRAIVSTLMVVLDQGVFGSFSSSTVSTIAEGRQGQDSINGDKEGDGIKPVIAYLSVNLHECSYLESLNFTLLIPISAQNAMDRGLYPVSPMSTSSHVDRTHTREKAEQVLEGVTTLLASSPDKLEKFMSLLPVTRICLLLLGQNPSPVIACQVLMIINLTLSQSVGGAFNRKFDLVGGWSVMRVVLPRAWDPSVHVAAFDLLLGRVPNNGGRNTDDKSSLSANVSAGGNTDPIACPHILPAILFVLHNGLSEIARADASFMSIDLAMDVLLEELMDLHASNSSFRDLFKLHEPTELLLNALKSFMNATSGNPSTKTTRLNRIYEKCVVLAGMMAHTLGVPANYRDEFFVLVRLRDNANSDSGPSSKPVTKSNDSKPKRPPPLKTRSASTFNNGMDKYDNVVSRIQEWRKSIARTERKRLRKMAQDIQEHHRQAQRLTQWRTSLLMEPGLWSTSTERKWRKKMEPENVKIISAKVVEEHSRGVEELDLEEQSQSPYVMENPPWMNTYDLSVDEDEEALAEDIREDNYRRVRHDLEPGDVIEAVKTATRIIGIDSSPGLLILGQTHLYMLDGLIEGPDGEVIEVRDAPRNLLSVPGTMVELDGIQRAQRWSYNQIVGFSNRAFLFRDVGFEIYFKDARSLLIVFGSKQDRKIIHSRLMAIQGVPNPALDVPTPSILRSPFLSRMGAKLLGSFRDEVSSAQRRWQAREISNFAYLSILNQASGRTPSDATQFPIFPWILKDYESETLDLTSYEAFRDLRKPMGILSPAREVEAISRYTSLESIGEKPFHYGTHFSSSMITCHFLMRLEPFTHMFKRLQGGDWDLPERLFTDIARAYRSASGENRADVRELIPEFFTCPEFLLNVSHVNFGVKDDGEPINDVKLPTWAKKDPLLFIVLHRRALESDYVSENLPAWIDLIWGCKQRDPASCNVFHPLSYEGSVDLDSMADDVEREATIGIIHNFGQTPRKLFTAPHPSRLMHGIRTLPLGTLHGIEEDHNLLSQSAKPIRDIKAPVMQLSVDVFSDKILPSQDFTLHVPGHPHEHVAWNFLDYSLRIYSDKKMVRCYELAHPSCAVFPDQDSLVTGSTDSKVRVWKVTHREHTTLSLSYILTGHRGRIISITASRAWSLIVSGGEDGLVMLWELNRAQYVRSITHNSPVSFVAINESTGYIASCSREKLCLHTINGHQIVSLDVGGGPPDGRITSLAFHEREWSYLGVLATGTVGGSIMLRTWNADETTEDGKAKWQFQTLRTLKNRLDEEDRTSSVTALKFIGETLYFGQDNGKVFSWDLPE